MHLCAQTHTGTYTYIHDTFILKQRTHMNAAIYSRNILHVCNVPFDVKRLLNKVNGDKLAVDVAEQ